MPASVKMRGEGIFQIMPFPDIFGDQFRQRAWHMHVLHIRLGYDSVIVFEHNPIWHSRISRTVQIPIYSDMLFWRGIRAW